MNTTEDHGSVLSEVEEDPNAKFACSNCERTFSTKSGLQTHMSRTHKETAEDSIAKARRRRMHESAVARAALEQERRSEKLNERLEKLREGNNGKLPLPDAESIELHRKLAQATGRLKNAVREYRKEIGK